MDRPLSGRCILVVEDQYLIADDIKRQLRNAGAKVVGPVAQVDAALSAMEEATIDIAVVDIHLGQETSLKVTTELTRRNIPFLIVTGYDSNAIDQNLQNAPRVEKPYGDTEIP